MEPSEQNKDEVKSKEEEEDKKFMGIRELGKNKKSRKVLAHILNRRKEQKEDKVLKDKQRLEAFIKSIFDKFWQSYKQRHSEERKKIIVFKKRAVHHQKFAKVKKIIKHLLTIITSKNEFDTSLTNLIMTKTFLNVQFFTIKKELEERQEAVKECLRHKDDIEMLDEIAQKEINRRELIQYPMIYDEIHLLFGKIFLHLHDNEYAHQILDQIKLYAMLPSQRQNLMQCYHGKSVALIRMGRYGESMRKAKRALELAFKLKDGEMELRLYDLFGQQYFYLGDIDKALYFHNRMVKSVLEPDDSPIKRMFLKKLENRNRRLKIIIDDYGSASYAELLNKIIKHTNTKVFDTSSDEDDMPVSKVAKNDYRIEYNKTEFPNFYKERKFNTTFSKVKGQKSVTFHYSRPKVATREGLRNLVALDKFLEGNNKKEISLTHMSANRNNNVYFHSRSRSEALMTHSKKVAKVDYKLKPDASTRANLKRTLMSSRDLFRTLVEEFKHFQDFLENKLKVASFHRFYFKKTIIGASVLKKMGFHSVVESNHPNVLRQKTVQEGTPARKSSIKFKEDEGARPRKMSNMKFFKRNMTYARFPRIGSKKKLKKKKGILKKIEMSATLSKMSIPKIFLGGTEVKDNKKGRSVLGYSNIGGRKRRRRTAGGKSLMNLKVV